MPNWNERLHILEYESAVALRYHGRRKEFFDRVSRLSPAMSVVFGGAAFAAITKGYPTAGAYAALTVAVLGALNLAFGFGDRARRHENLFRQWGALRAKLAALQPNDDEALRVHEVNRAEIDAESPWQLLALSTLCENEEKTMRREGLLYRVGPAQRAIITFGTLPGWHPVLDKTATREQQHA